MQLVKSLTVDAIPTLTDLFRFALISSLELFKSILLLYPLNVCLFIIVTLVIFHKIIKMALPKTKFSSVYVPLKHQQNSPEEIKVLKKEIREIQSGLIQIIKQNQQNPANTPENTHQSNGQDQNENQLRVMLQSFSKEGKERSTFLEEVEKELKSTVVAAYDEIVKVKIV